MSPVLRWDKPSKVMTEQERRRRGSSDCGVPGTYLQNMSRRDMESWKAELAGTRVGPPRVEIRVTRRGSQLKIVVSREPVDEAQVRVSANGPIRFSIEDWEDFKGAVDEAFAVLDGTAK